MQNNTAFKLIERMASLIRAEERKKCTLMGLQNVHLQVLDYLSLCNKYSDTPAALANYLGMTRGTVSQTLLLLEKKGLIKKNQDVNDRRVVHLEILPLGSELLTQLKLTDLFDEASKGLSADRHVNYDIVMANVLAALQKANRSYSFGLCKTCRFFTTDPDGFVCGLTKETLTQTDSEKICQEHTVM